MDPVRGSPQSWNGYAYVRSNPLKYVDPDGRERAQILLDNDVRDLQSGKIDAEQYWERVRARGEGALLGVAVIETGIALSGAIAGGVLRKTLRAADDVVPKARGGELVVKRTTRAGDPRIRVTRSDGSVIDITPNRVKEFVPEPRANSGLRPVKFDEAIPGSKGKKRLPTKEELKLLEIHTGGAP